MNATARSDTALSASVGAYDQSALCTSIDIHEVSHQHTQTLLPETWQQVDIATSILVHKKVKLAVELLPTRELEGNPASVDGMADECCNTKASFK